MMPIVEKSGKCIIFGSIPMHKPENGPINQKVEDHHYGGLNIIARISLQQMNNYHSPCHRKNIKRNDEECVQQGSNNTFSHKQIAKQLLLL
jgi:hypothetical protein